MIVIRLEMWPRGDHTKGPVSRRGNHRQRGRNGGHGQLRVQAFKAPEYSKQAETRPLHKMLAFPLAREIWRKGNVEGFPRSRLGPWDLLFRALGAMIDKRNPGVSFDAEVRVDSFGPPDASTETHP